MHGKHGSARRQIPGQLSYANSKTGYYSYYQSVLPHVDNKISSAFRSMPCCQNHIISSTKTESHNVAGRIGIYPGDFWGRVCWARGGGDEEKESLGAQEHGSQPSRSSLA
eukprot:113994-Pelagomonas_calceolata.AAC.1